MRTSLNNTPTLHNHNLVGITHRTQTMSYHHYSTSAVEICKIFHYLSFVLCIKRIGRFIKEYEIRRAIHGTCYEQTLFLSLAKPHTVTSYFRIIL